MSIIKLNLDNFERYDLVARPKKIFRSSSNGIEGDILLMKDASPSLKDISRKQVNTGSRRGFANVVSQYDDEKSENLTFQLNAYTDENGNPNGGAEDAFEKIHSASQGLRYQKRQEVFRTFPGTKLNKEFLKKKVIKNVLFEHYKSYYDSMEWGYTNYHCLNFYENSKVPSNSALIYPAVTGVVNNVTKSLYTPDAEFTIQFYIKPKNNAEGLVPNTEISPGTVLHMSSCFAISLVTGSSRGIDGITDSYRIMMQLSQSADIKPSRCIVTGSKVTAAGTSADTGMMFISSDNSIPKDSWTHVAMRWPGSKNNGGTGSFVINGVEDNKFTITSGTVMQTTTSVGSGIGNPDAIFVGNYFDGKNSGTSTIARFFNTEVSTKDGLTNLINASDEPTPFTLDSPLRAEVHEIKIFNSYRELPQIISDKKEGKRSIDSDLLFYVPPFFTEESRRRDILQTPFMTDRGHTNDPFNISLSFGLGSLDINLENFTREWVQKEYPRLYNLSSSANNTSVYQEGLTSNDVIYRDPAARKKLRTVLPCDNGLFRPDYELLKTGSDLSNRFIDSYGTERLDLISLEDLVTTGTLLKDLALLDDVTVRSPADGGSYLSGPAWGSLEGKEAPFGPTYFLNDVVGASPEDPSIPSGSILSVLHRTGDPSSNEVVMFDISNMFYGDSITPGSILLEDLAPSGSEGSFTFKVRDNKRGSLYRADLSDDSKAAKWASVGNVFYDDGIILIKSPHLALFGQEDFRLTFKGNRTVYVYEVIVPVEASMFNSSSNPTYRDLKPSDYANESAEKFTYISGINLHDDNLNVVGKATLSQPFLKREEDRVVIKLRMDF